MRFGIEKRGPARAAGVITAALALALVPVRGYSVENQSASSPGSDARLARVSADVQERLVGESFPSPRSFAVHVPQGRDSIVLTAKAQDPNASVSINGSPAPNGEPAAAIPLAHGINFIDVAVTSADGTATEHYEVKVIRAYPTPNWTKVLDTAPWPPRDSAGELTFDGKMWLFGGYTPDIVGDVWSSTDGVTWDRRADIPNPAGVNIPAIFAFNGRMWVTSGGSLYSSADGAKWDLVLEKVPWSPGIGAVLNGRMWVVGGGDGRQVWSSSDGVNWKLVQPNAPWSRRTNFGNFLAHAGRLWVLGGALGRYQPFKGYRDVWCSEDGVNWTCATEQAPWPGRWWSCSLSYRGRMWLIGGFRGQPTWQNFNDVWYSADGREWRQLVTDDVWSPRHEISGYVHDNKLWVVAGNAWPLVNDVWQLSIPGMMFTSQPVFEEFVGAQYRYEAQADFNESGGPISYRLVRSPGWLRINENTGVITGVPDSAGDFQVVVEAFDAAGETARQEYTLHVVTL